VRFGRDYGWPQVTLGAQYRDLTLPGQDRTLAANHFETPAFAWTPSIATSDLIDLTGSEFEHWQGDLMVSTLADRALYRVRLIDDTPILAERIPVFERVRDLVQDREGRIVFWTDRAVIGVIEAVDAP